MELHELTPKQNEYQAAVRSGQYRYLLFGGGIRCGKTAVGMAMLFLFMKMWPGSRWAIVRNSLPTLRRNTIVSYEKFRPTHFMPYGIHTPTWTVTATNGSQLLFFAESIATDPELNRWRGLEVNGFLLEEANELQEASFMKAIERAGSWIIPGRGQNDQPPPMILLTCNPSPGWVKERFYLPHRNGTIAAPYYFLQATVKDNPYLPTEYLESLKSLDPVSYRRFVEGDWDVSDDPMQLITYEWIRACQNIEAVDGENVLGVDVAREGDDESVISHVSGNALRGLYARKGVDTVELADLVQHYLQTLPVNADRCRIDTVGLGAGTYDTLKRRGYTCEPFVAGGKAIWQDNTQYIFGNRRAQGWWTLRELLRTANFSLPAYLPPKLLQDLTSPKYDMRGDRMLTVESKQDIGKRIGRSTDFGDALMMAVAPSAPRPVFAMHHARY